MCCLACLIQAPVQLWACQVHEITNVKTVESQKQTHQKSQSVRGSSYLEDRHLFIDPFSAGNPAPAVTAFSMIARSAAASLLPFHLGSTIPSSSCQRSPSRRSRSARASWVSGMVPSNISSVARKLFLASWARHGPLQNLPFCSLGRKNQARQARFDMKRKDKSGKASSSSEDMSSAARFSTICLMLGSEIRPCHNFMAASLSGVLASLAHEGAGNTKLAFWGHVKNDQNEKPKGKKAGFAQLGDDLIMQLLQLGLHARQALEDCPLIHRFLGQLRDFFPKRPAQAPVQISMKSIYQS